MTVDKLWRTWWLTFLSAAALMCAYCLLQLSGSLEIHQGGVRVDGTIGNAAYLAAYLLFAVAVAVWQALESKGFLRYSLFTLAAVEVIIVYFTATRGAVLGLIGGIGIGAVLWMIESGSRGRKVAGGLFVALVLLVGGFYISRNSDFVKSEPTLARVTSISVSDLSVRSALWGMALQGVAERPITGWGQEGFNYVFNKYYKPELYAQEPWFDRAHNVFIDWLVGGGIPAFLLFIGLFVSAVIALYKREASRAERVLLISALAAYGIQAIVVFDNLFTYVPLAALLATAHAASARPWKFMESLPKTNESSLQIALPLTAVIAIASIWMINVPNIAAASSLVQGLSVTSANITPNIAHFQDALNENTYAKQEIREQLVIFMSNVVSQRRAPIETLNSLAQLSLTEMGKEIESQPKDARLRLEYALGFRVVGDTKNAIAQTQVARELSPKKQTIMLELGIEYWQVGDFEKAREVFHQAYDLDRSFNAVAEYAAAGDIAAGHVSEGKDLLIKAEGTAIVDSEPVILAYYQAKAFPELIASLQLQVKNQQGSVNSRFKLASAYLAAGRNSDARKEIEETVAAHPEASAQAAEFLKSVPK